MLRIIYEFGRGTPKNQTLANEWFLKSANNNNVHAQMNIAMKYHDGLNGLPKDINQARLWLVKAAANGNDQAKLMLSKI